MNKVDLLQENKLRDTENTFYGGKSDFAEKAIGELKGEGEYRIKSPIVDWAENESAI